MLKKLELEIRKLLPAKDKLEHNMLFNAVYILAFLVLVIVFGKSVIWASLITIALSVALEIYQRLDGGTNTKKESLNDIIWSNVTHIAFTILYLFG